ncbi:endonuclease V [Carex littledalei]|uniref:Endonuclease V n=1 Tax=Carex littledalei TaxID=544730 RepID=A0A833VLG5_9POAL|nr:endonuclease V [Carex littledalei]
MEETSRRKGNDVYPDEWVRTQDLLKRKLVAADDFTWKLTSCDLDSGPNEQLRYVGGTDISFLKEDPSIACAALVILEIGTLKIVHEEFDLVRLDVPYIPGFLAFREAPILLRILEKMKADGNPFYPQLLMVDGNGVLHPRGFGLACHIGVLANLPTIGVGKNLHHIDGLSREEVRRKLEGPENSDNNILPLIGESGKIWGAALRPGPGSLKPVYISIGHRVSLDSAITLVKMCSKFRVPEPTRQADIRSKVFLQKHRGSPNFNKLVI